MAKTLDDIFNDDDFEFLNSKEKSGSIKTDEDRLIDAFEEVNRFFEKNNREPATGSMTEYNLSARLKGYREDETKQKTLKPFDRFNLLGNLEPEKKTLDEILKEDEMGLLEPAGDVSIFEFKHIPRHGKRAESDFIAQRQPIPEEDFKVYEEMFQQVHRDLKTGARKMAKFDKFDTNLQVGNFYLLDGLLLFLESANLQEEVKKWKRVRLDGRTVTIFENGTMSNLLFRSLGKAIQKNGNLITLPEGSVVTGIFKNINVLSSEDVQNGWIYVLKSKSVKKEILEISDLYKVGFSKMKVEERIKNASNEATYLFADVEIVASYSCYNINVRTFENLIHRFFGESCLNVDLYNKEHKRYIPREWFVVPLQVINEAIELLINGTIINYRYDVGKRKIVLR